MQPPYIRRTRLQHRLELRHREPPCTPADDSEYNASGTLLRRYVHGAGVDEPLVWYEGSGVSAANRRYLHANHQGSIVARSAPSGTTQQISVYDAYGVTTSANTGRFQYTGQAAIPELGLYHYKARVYDPNLGRFLQTDPIGYGDDQNLYAYVYNDPLNRTDPTGEFADTLADIGFIAYGIYKLAEDPSWTNAAALGADVVGAAVPFATGLGAAVRTGERAATLGKNAERGAAREAKMTDQLKRENPGASVQNQHYLRDAKGNIVKDPKTGEARRVDHAVIKDGKAATYETTSRTANKDAQAAKEDRVRDAGGTYVRDRQAGKLCPVGEPSEIRRCD